MSYSELNNSWDISKVNNIKNESKPGTPFHDTINDLSKITQDNPESTIEYQETPIKKTIKKQTNIQNKLIPINRTSTGRVPYITMLIYSVIQTMLKFHFR